jgi:NAD(P)-dependent dehydrogenase (short-subunit alcohol dehydrogenase family)
MGTNELLKDRYALVTGGSRGIGRAIAETLAQSGSNVAIVSRRLQDSEESAREIGKTCGVATLGCSCDVSRLEDVHRMFETLRLWSQDRLDVLVCCAGYAFLPEIWETPLHTTPRETVEAWYTDIYRTDTLGSVFCTYEALPLMIERRTGSIVYIASTPAIEGYQGTPYTIAKAGILGLMRDVAQEYGKFNIRANALALGNIETPATFGPLTEKARTALALEAPLRRWGNVEEVGRAALFFASNQSSFITGQTLVVDGGTVRR